MATPKQTDPQFKLRLTPKLKEQIEQAALANNRSMNAEIVAQLEDHPRIQELELRQITDFQQRKLLSDQLARLEQSGEELIRLRERCETLVQERNNQDDYIKVLREEVERYKLESVRQQAMVVAGREMGTQMEKVFAELSQSLREEIADLRAWLRVLETANASLKASNKTLSDLLEWHDKMIEDAAKGDDRQLRIAVETRFDPALEAEIRRSRKEAKKRADSESDPLQLSKEEWEVVLSAPKEARQSIMAALMGDDKDGLLRIAKRAAIDAEQGEAGG